MIDPYEEEYEKFLEEETEKYYEYLNNLYEEEMKRQEKEIKR